MSHSLVERDLDKIEANLRLDLGRSAPDSKDEDYYPQFEHVLRVEAAGMGEHYELFYCLETSIRKLVAETLESAYGETWWDTCVPTAIKTNVQSNIQREIDSGVTPRSEEEIDFTTFGELGEIVKNKW